MTFEQIIKDLKNKVYHPVYFLHGTEPYYIDKITDHITKDVLDEDSREFNQTVLYGREADMLTLLSYAKRFPMMSDYQVVVVKEAQDMKDLFGKEKGDGKSKDPFTAYLESPLRSTILVFCYKYKTVDKRTKIAKVLKEKTVFFDSKKIYDDKLPAWIHAFVNDRSLRISPAAANLLAEYLGNDLSRISNEIEKLILNLKDKKEITAEHIELYIGISKEFNVFELQKAIGAMDVLKANRIVNYFIANPKSNPMVLTMGNFYNYFSKLMLYHSLNDKGQGNIASALGVNPFFVKEYTAAARHYPAKKIHAIIHYMRECDMKSKGVGSTESEPGELLRELVFKIMH